MTRARLRPTLRLRLTALYGVVFLVTGAALLALNYGLVRHRLTTALHGSAVTRSRSATGEAGLPADLQPLVKADPTVVGDLAKLIQAHPALAQIIINNKTEQAIRDRVEREALHQLLVESLIALGVMGVASILLGWLVAGRALRPLQSITAAAKRASGENLSERLDMTGPNDELKELADTFDQMLARLEAAFESQRRFVANASHELRTPLAVARTAIDVTLAKRSRTPAQLEAMAAEVRTATENAERLLASLLTLARSERGVEINERIDLADTARGAITAGQDQAAAGQVDIHSDLRPAPVDGDPSLLERLVANLIHNAARYNIRGGQVTVTTGSNGHDSFVEVSNTGPVIDADVLDSYFEPFRRGAGERVHTSEGSGLGLAIAKSITTAHGGTITASPLDGGGLRIAVRIPGPTRSVVDRMAQTADTA